MVLTALAQGFDRGKRGGRVDPGKGVWLKTFIYIYIYSCQGFPLDSGYWSKNRRGWAGGGGR